MLWWFWRRAELCSTAPVTALSLTLRQLRANLQAEKTAQSTVLTSHHYSASGTVILTNRTHHRNTGGIKTYSFKVWNLQKWGDHWSRVWSRMCLSPISAAIRDVTALCDRPLSSLSSQQCQLAFFKNLSWSKLKTGCFLTFSNQSTFLFILKWKDWKWSLYLSPPVINVSRLFSDWHCESCGIKNMMAALKLT